MQKTDSPEKDLYTQYGVFVWEDGFNEMISLPTRHAITVNDWHEEEGIELPPTLPSWQPKECTVVFGYCQGFERAMQFINLCRERKEILLDFRALQFREGFMSFTYKGHDVVWVGENIGRFVVRFAQHDPTTDKHINPNQTPNPYYTTESAYRLNGGDTTRWGMHILQGSLLSLIGKSEAKPYPMTQEGKPIEFGYNNYYRPLQRRSHEAQINALMRAHNLTELWGYWGNLTWLLQQQEVLLSGGELTHGIPFVYKSSTVTRFVPSGAPWLEFTLQVLLPKGP